MVLAQDLLAGRDRRLAALARLTEQFGVLAGQGSEDDGPCLDTPKGVPGSKPTEAPIRQRPAR